MSDRKRAEDRAGPAGETLPRPFKRWKPVYGRWISRPTSWDLNGQRGFRGTVTHARIPRERGHAPGGLKDRRRRTKVPHFRTARVTCVRLPQRFSRRADGRVYARDLRRDRVVKTIGGRRIHDWYWPRRTPFGTRARTVRAYARQHERDVTSARVRCVSRDAVSKRRASSFVSTTRHTHSPHTRDAKHPNAIGAYLLSLSHSFGPAILPFEFSLSPRRREEHCVSYSSLATLSPLPATSVSRAFLSSLLASPTSTRDLFTNPSTIPADWLAARRDRRRARRNTGRCQQAASYERAVTRGNVFHGVERESCALRRGHTRTHVVDRHHGRSAYRRAYSRVYETRTTAHSIHVPPWGISAITNSYIWST